MEAIAQATDQALGMETAFLNILVNKAIRAIGKEDAELDLSKPAAINSVTRAIEALLRVKRQELTISREKMEEAKGKLRTGGLSEDTIREIEESVLGLKR